MTEQVAGSGGSRVMQRVGLAVIEGAVAFAVLYVLGHRDLRVFIPVVATIVVSALVPPRFSRLVSGVCLLGVATYFYLEFHWKQIPAALGIIGIVLVIAGVVRAREK